MTTGMESGKDTGDALSGAGSGRPAYRAIAAELHRAIAAGELEPGEALPSEAELTKRYGVSRGTARRVLDQLVSDGVAVGGQGKVRRVRKTAHLTVYASRSESNERRTAAGTDAWVTDVTEQGRQPGQVIRVEIVPAGPVISKWLQVDADAIVAVRRRLRTVDGHPANLNDTYYPMDIAQEVPQILNPADVPEGVIALMRQHGYEQVRYVDNLNWRPPSPEETAQLGIPPGVAVLVQMRTGYTSERPVKTTVTILPGDRHDLVYELSA